MSDHDVAQVVDPSWLDCGFADITFDRPVLVDDQIRFRVSTVNPVQLLTPIFCQNDSDGLFNVDLLNQESKCCMRVVMGYGEANWLTSAKLPVAALGPNKLRMVGKLLPESASKLVGEQLIWRAIPITKEIALRFLKDKTLDADSAFWSTPNDKGELPVHPAFIAWQGTPLLQHSIDHLPAIHTQTRMQLLSRAFTSETRPLFASGVLVDVFDRKRNHYVVVDCLICTDEGKPIAMIRHTTIFAIRASKL